MNTDKKQMVEDCKWTWKPWFLALLLLTSALAGCASHPAAPPALVPSRAYFPGEAFIIQRVMFTAHGGQYPLNGYLALSETRGKRLVLMDTLNMVVADVLIKPDGRVFVMKSSRMFPARYLRRLVAADVQCVFGGRPALDCPVSSPAPNEYVIDRGRYQLDLRILQVKPGRQPDPMFDETTKK